MDLFLLGLRFSEEFHRFDFVVQRSVPPLPSADSVRCAGDDKKEDVLSGEEFQGQKVRCQSLNEKRNGEYSCMGLASRDVISHGRGRPGTVVVRRGDKVRVEPGSNKRIRSLIVRLFTKFFCRHKCDRTNFLVCICRSQDESYK